MPLVIAKTLLPDTAKFAVALSRVFGIGRSNGLAVAEEIGISSEIRVADVKAHHVRQVLALINERFKVGMNGTICDGSTCEVCSTVSTWEVCSTVITLGLM